jgi:hypothetical protein
MYGPAAAIAVLCMVSAAIDAFRAEHRRSYVWMGVAVLDAFILVLYRTTPTE